VSRPHTAKPVTTKGPSRRCGGGRGKVVALIRGGLLGVPKDARSPQWCSPGGEWTTGPARFRCTVEKSAEAIVPAGMKEAGKGRTHEREGHAFACSQGVAMTAANPAEGPRQEGRRVNPDDARREPSDSPAPEGPDPHPAPVTLFESVLSRENLTQALKRVEQNAGAPGPDGMTTAELRPWLHAHWPGIREKLDAGTYRPSPVRRVQIPKPSGGTRDLGVPTVLDRLLQQALLQVLTPVFDPHFSDRSYGFRPGRSAHQAVRRAQEAMAEGHGWVVDLDLEAFFDRVNHDALMARVARTVKDKKVLKLLRAYLNAGIMAQGVLVRSQEGTPQGSPLSPLLANIMLDDLDQELTQRGHCFVRYADDLMIYVQSERAGERVMAGTRRFVGQKLKLRVNEAKSAVAPASARPFLGFAFFRRHGEVQVRLDPKARAAAKQRLRRLAARSWRVSMAVRIVALNRFTRGWTAYFALADTPSVFAELDEWLRRRLRQVRWKEWKRPRTRARNLCALGIPAGTARQWALTRKGYWRVAGSVILSRALPNAYWQAQGLVGFSGPYRRFRDARRTAGCGPACPVVWEGPG
jgi:RNA-directed DNA polymerase